ncbi:MAG: formylglycine-generating enzyme family protein, partial [SAR324 cluster bacterium]|nr:formylglycine-generating enzyme family protein [SAR324 cluster bacterium]
MRNLPLKRRYYRNFFLLSGFLFSVHIVWATALDFQKLVRDFQQSAISDFVAFTTKGERYPLIHTISELRFRVFTEKLGINRRVETKVCSDHRTYGISVPRASQKFCDDYDNLVELAKVSIAQTQFFENIYLAAEPALLNEIERQRARDAVRVWIRQKLNCLNEEYRCGHDERKMIKRVT